MAYIAFQTPEHYYLYDREKSRMPEISARTYEAIIAKCRGEEREEDAEIWENLHRQGFCLDSELKEIEHPASVMMEYHLNRKLGILILQVTQGCNLRCEYCAYSGKYHNRTHSNKRMSYETACRAVDFLIAHSTDQPRVTVGFYGGEPLLEFDLIRRVVAYVEKNYPGKEVGYNMTTNATLLTDEVVDYLVEKDFGLMFSLDGPKEIHDIHRKFADGKGSFDVVMKNLARMKERYPDFYRKCRTNTVISPQQDYKCMQDFFDTDEVLDSLGNGISLISDVGIREPVVYEEAFYIRQREETLKLYLSLLGEVEEEKVSGLYRSAADRLKRTHRELTYRGKLGKKNHPGGPCIVGEKKTFVTADGYLYPCEKLSETEELRIGSLDTGFDVARAIELQNIGKTTEEACKKCWAFLFCESCVAASLDENGMNAESRLRHCKQVKAGALSSLRDYALMQELGFDFEKN